MDKQGHGFVGRIVRKAALAALGVTAATALAAGPVSARDTFTARPPEPKPWWCWSQECVDFSAAGCASIGGEHWEVDLGFGWWGGCELP